MANTHAADGWSANGSARHSAKSIAQILGRARQGTDGWWHCRCCAHDDENPSLAVRDTDDGAVAWRCFAGCDTKAVGAELVARGLLPDPATERKDSRRKIVATYGYRDETGELLFEVVRFEPKDFRQRRPDGNGNWLWKLGSTRRVLYRLPELLAADPAEPVFIVEGEKDADRLRALGFVATTNPQGAGKWGKADRAALAGRHVVVLPDNDQAGRDHAAR